MTRPRHSPASIAEHRERMAREPVNVAAILSEGKLRRADLIEEGRDTAALARVQASVYHRLAVIEHTVSAAVRARRLGDLANWLASDDMLALFDRATMIPQRRRIYRRETAGA